MVRNLNGDVLKQTAWGNTRLSFQTNLCGLVPAKTQRGKMATEVTLLPR